MKDNPLKVYNYKPYYRIEYGYILWVFHRITGIALSLYAYLHIYIISSVLYGEESFNKVILTLQSPLFHILEIGLLACIVIHLTNGFRVVAVDFFGNVVEKGNHRIWIYIVFVVSIILIMIGSIPFIRAVFLH